jgi:hypothetical protein
MTSFSDVKFLHGHSPRNSVGNARKGTKRNPSIIYISDGILKWPPMSARVSCKLAYQ